MSQLPTSISSQPSTANTTGTGSGGDSAVDPKAVLRQLASGQLMSESQAEQVFNAILQGKFDDAQIGGLLCLINARPGGPTIEELVGGARAMRAHVTRVPVPAAKSASPPVLIDTCGTGGAPKTFNVSTIAAIIAAAAAPGKVMIAKHGSTSRTGRGSSEVLEKLGVNVSAPPAVQTRCLAEVGVCFCFAVHHHPAMKAAAGPRASLGFPTIFNLLGPLTNPAGAQRQLMGAYHPDLADKLAKTLSRLGTEGSIVVNSRDGLDELTTTDTNVLYHVPASAAPIKRSTLDARSLGLSPSTMNDLQVQTVADAARVMREIVTVRSTMSAAPAASSPAAITTPPDPRRDLALLNAAGALVVAGAADDFPHGLALSREAVNSGRAVRTLRDLIRLTHEPVV